MAPPFFERLVEHAFDVALVCDADATVRFANPALERHYGYRPEDVIGQTVWQFVHPDDHGQIAEALAALVTQPGHHEALHVRVRAADGEWRCVEGAAVGFCDDPEVAGIVVNVRDVTERVRTEEALARSAARMTALLANIGDVVSVHGADGKVRYVSPSVNDLVGEHASEELLGCNPFDLVVESDRARVFGVVRDWPRQRNGDAVEFDVQIPDSGETRTLEASAVNLLDDPLVEGIVVTTRDVTERRRTERELSRLALNDTLTGLPNRQLLLDRVERALLRHEAGGPGVAVLFVDLDDFKAINDAAGHHAGDELLIEAARRLSAIVRPSDTVGRWGGDEFVVVVEAIDEADAGADVLTLADGIRAAMGEPFAVPGTGDVYVGASIGIATTPTDGPAALLSAADAAMHQAKERGRARAEVFDDDLRAAVVERLRLQSELPRALARDEFELHFQPIIDLTTGAPVAAETLIRWRHPTRGLLPPAAFLPAAERSGLITDIGAWVLRAACEEAARWATTKGVPLRVAVNLSARQLADLALVDEIQRVLAETGLDPCRLTLEVTESADMADAAAATEILARVRELGVRVAVDDFGTGYSSLGYLRRLPCDVVKIDRSFVAGIGSDDEDSVIVAAVVALAHTLGLDVTAEGCEHQIQATKLAELGADLAQGYLWSKPVPAEDLPDLVRALAGD